MLLRTKGQPNNIDRYFIGRITRDVHKANQDSILIDEGQIPHLAAENFLGLLTSNNAANQDVDLPVIYNIPSLNHLSEGDIVLVNPKGDIRTLYRPASHHNILFATDRCNSNCLMCSQPPKDKDDIQELYQVNQRLISLIPKDCFELCITGGEPTLMGELFFATLEMLKDRLPDTEIHVLTNGRSFAWRTMAERLGQVNHERLMLGIPVYADYYYVHDYIVQAKGAFYQTIQGLHNLAAYNQKVEIRIVLHKQSIPRLVKLARYIYKNLPFASHVTFMGLEYVGYTPHNIEKLWIDPYDYISELQESVEFLAGQGMHVSIYNMQLCLLPEPLWGYARKSISDWKNSYLPVCATCSKKDDCGGLFTWNLEKHSKYIRAIN